MLRIAKIAALVSAVVLLNAVTTLLFVQSRVPAVAQLGPPACVDGDVNGDAGLNIGDPIYLLQHLFQGGPGPVACAQGATASELESVLAKFFPRLADRWEWQTNSAAPANDAITEVLTVPVGKLLVVTAIEPFAFIQSGAAWGPVHLWVPGSPPSPPIVHLLRNGVPQPSSSLLSGIAAFWSGSGASVGSLTHPDSESAVRIYHPGDVLAIQRTEAFTGVALYGYWADAP